MTRKIIIDKKLIPIAEKITKVINSFPLLDGHFWVIRDGKIIDPYFKYYDFLKSYHNGVKLVYYPADENTQTLMNSIHIKQIEKNYGDFHKFIEDYINVAGNERKVDFCVINALLEIYENGGDLVFGSMGVERKDGTKFYEYGGEDYVGVKAFIKVKK